MKKTVLIMMIVLLGLSTTTWAAMSITFGRQTGYYGFNGGGEFTIKVTYFPAWTAADQDGELRELRDNGGYMAFTLEEGEEVVIRLAPTPIHYLGTLVSLLSAAFLIFLFNSSGKSHRRRK